MQVDYWTGINLSRFGSLLVFSVSKVGEGSAFIVFSFKSGGVGEEGGSISSLNAAFIFLALEQAL